MRTSSSLLRNALLAAAVCLSPTLSPATLFGQTADPADYAFGRLKTLDDSFVPEPPRSAEQWKQRRGEVHRRMQVALGLDPMPAIAPPDAAEVFGRVERDGFTVERVIFHSIDGLQVTGSLFRPVGEAAEGSRPAVLCPHGHWANGRFYRASDAEVANQLATGAERFETAARNPIIARCVQLARMGCVVFAWDMLGYADSRQIPLERAHGWGNAAVNPPRSPEEEDPYLFGAKAEMYSQSVMGLQTINSLAAYRFVASLPEVDDKKIAITGASGGATQSFIAAAVEPGISVAFPAVMVSTAMQGGCTCENACHLRVGTGNIELAGLVAPRPMGLTAADDWTIHVAEVGFPQLKAIYGTYGAADKVKLFAATHFPHNFNHVSRVALYGWINDHFELGHDEPILERDYEYLSPADLSVWRDVFGADPAKADVLHEPPTGEETGLEFEAKLLAEWQTAIDAALKLQDGQPADDEAAESLVRGWQTIYEPAVEWADSLKAELVWRVDEPTAAVLVTNDQDVIVGRVAFSVAEPTREFKRPLPRDLKLPESVVIYLDEDAQPESEPDNDPTAMVATLFDPVGIPTDSEETQPLINQPRPAAAYTFGYNAPLLVRKSGVLLAAIRLLEDRGVEQVTLRADGSQAAIAAGCVVAEPGSVAGITRTGGADFSFREVRSIRDARFIPGALRYQDVAGLMYAAKARDAELKVE